MGNVVLRRHPVMAPKAQASQGHLSQRFWTSDLNPPDVEVAHAAAQERLAGHPQAVDDEESGSLGLGPDDIPPQIQTGAGDAAKRHRLVPQESRRTREREL